MKKKLLSFNLVEHPLIKRDLTLLRDERTKPEYFREAVRRISNVLAVEISKDLKLKTILVNTPLEGTKGYKLNQEIILIPVLRAGLSMVSGFLDVVPDCKVGHIGLQRNEVTLLPIEYYFKTPALKNNSKVILLDPMLATGGSASEALRYLKKKGGKKIVFACLVAAPTGVMKINKDHPDVKIFGAALDRELNNKGYIFRALETQETELLGLYRFRFRRQTEFKNKSKFKVKSKFGKWYVLNFWIHKLFIRIKIRNSQSEIRNKVMQSCYSLLQYKLVLIIIFFCISFSFTSAQVYPDPVVDSLLNSGIKNIINQNYDLAKKDFVILDKNFSNIPLGKIYLAAVEIAKSSDLALPFNSNFIKEKIEEAKEISESLIDKDEYNTWNYYFLALADGYEAYFNALNDVWLSALGAGVTSVNLFEHCLEMYPQFYESLIAIGTYKYWKSKETSWLPFLNDERKEGIELLEKAVIHSSYNSYLAINSLIWIYIDKSESGKAIKLAEASLLKYPRCRFFRFGLARAYEDVDLNKAIEEYSKILNSYSSSEKPNRYNEILLKHLIAQQHNKLGEKKISLELCEEILSIKDLTEYEQLKLKARLERVKELKRELLTAK